MTPLETARLRRVAHVCLVFVLVLGSPLAVHCEDRCASTIGRITGSSGGRLPGIAETAANAATNISSTASRIRSSWPHGLCGTLIVVLCVALDAERVVAQGSAQDQPELPRLAIDRLPPAARAGFQRTYDAAQAHPRDPSAVGRLGMMLHANQQYRSAEICYRTARRLAPRSMSWAYLSAVVRAELGEDGAADAFRQSLSLDPNYLPARVGLADALMRAGALETSRNEYEALVRDFPELALAHYGLGRIASTLGDSKDAARHYQRAVEVSPSFGTAHYALALAYRDAGIDDRAQAHLEAYRRLGSRRPVPPDRLLDEVRSMIGTARDLIAEGARIGRSGRHQESIALHLKALVADPLAAQAHVNLISLYGRTGQSDRAEEHYRAAIRLGSSLGDAHYNYGVLLASGRRFIEAADAFRKTIDVDPFHAQAHNNLAALLVAEGKREEAAAHYRQAIASDPQHRIARFNLGRLLVALGRPLEAVGQFQKALLPEDTDTPRYTYALASAYFVAGDLALARAYGEQALRGAMRLGQTDLAVQIENEMPRLGAGRK